MGSSHLSPPEAPRAAVTRRRRHPSPQSPLSQASTCLRSLFEKIANSNCADALCFGRATHNPTSLRSDARAAGVESVNGANPLSARDASASSALDRLVLSLAGEKQLARSQATPAGHPQTLSSGCSDALRASSTLVPPVGPPPAYFISRLFRSG